MLRDLHRLKRSLKLAVAHGLYLAGLLQLWQRIALRRRAVVLMYHRVLTSEQRRRTGSHPGIVVDQQTFAAHMAFLKRRFVTLSLSEFTDRLERKEPFPDSSCLVTFDDGWRDNYTNALPVLQRHDIPALIFLPVNYIGGDRLFWQEALTHLLLRAVEAVRKDTERLPRIREILEPVGLAHILETRIDEPRPVIVEALGHRKEASGAVAGDVIATLAAELETGIDGLTAVDNFMDWNQVRAMSQHRVEFGGHGAEHKLLTLVPGDEADREVRTCKEVLDQRVEETIPTFSYPNGSWNQLVRGAVKTHGYRLAFTTEPGSVSCDDDPLTVRRVNIHEDATNTTPMFLARLVGLF